MTEFVVGGRRRIDRVLAPGFLDELGGLDLDEVRARRADAEQEEVDLSYVRRMLQGRLDLLRAEQHARSNGGPSLPAARTVPGSRSDAEIAESLAHILADEPRTDHGLGRHLGNALPSRIGEHRREAERAVADVASSDTVGLSDTELAATIDNLADVERRVSGARRQVQAVVDALTHEIAQRYADGDLPVTLP